MAGRHAVWILGSASTLCAYSKLWRNLVDDAKQVSSFVDATQVQWMNDHINASKKYNKPVSQQRDEDERATKVWEQQPKMPASPKKSGWESEEPSMVCPFVTLILLFSNAQRAGLCNNCYYTHVSANFRLILQMQFSVQSLRFKWNHEL